MQKLPANEYLQEEAVVLVDKYMTYLDQKKQAEEELDKLKEAIIKYADDHDLARINGSRYSLTLTRKDIIRFPPEVRQKGKNWKIF